MMELPLPRNLVYNQGLFFQWSVVHFEMNINDNDSRDMIIPNQLSSTKYQNERSASTSYRQLNIKMNYQPQLKELILQ